jgi:hypothetical protein
MQSFFEQFLNSKVYNNGQSLPYLLGAQTPIKKTSYIFLWAVDMYAKTPYESRYWFEPVLSLCLPSAIVGLGIAVLVSTLLPQKVGYVRHGIEREVISLIEKISIHKYGVHTENSYNEIVDELLRISQRDLYTYVDEWNINIEDLKVLHKAVKFLNSSLPYQVLHINDGINAYMRYYFTVKYSNTILGFVYIGAAVLIIMIGLRGLKFIPSTQPSFVLFALGLEFSLLITYAVTLMYSRNEDEVEREMHNQRNQKGKSSVQELLGNSREVENLLRVFLHTKKQR